MKPLLWSGLMVGPRARFSCSWHLSRTQLFESCPSCCPSHGARHGILHSCLPSLAQPQRSSPARQHWPAESPSKSFSFKITNYVVKNALRQTWIFGESFSLTRTYQLVAGFSKTSPSRIKHTLRSLFHEKKLDSRRTNPKFLFVRAQKLHYSWWERP